MISRKSKLRLLKLLSLFSVVRGYNILILVIAQYLASIYILAPQKPLAAVLFDHELFVLVLASSLAIAAGYIINNFYDSEKDRINRPTKTLIDNYVSQRTKLSVYFLLNFLTVVLASYVSFRAVAFFSIYIFFLWFYSHKLKKFPFIGNITASILAVVPFFAVFIYYKNFEPVIFLHATYLFLVLSLRELVKDLENIKGDFVQDYRTIPVVYGIRLTKRIASLLVFLTIIPVTILIAGNFQIGYMVYFFWFSFAVLLVFLIFLWKSQSKIQYTLLHNLLKLVIVLGVFSILLIDVDVVLNRIL
ncbi:MAG TPA: geranylgeranylglycerol-phosphate geranylgeranyltransferase [Flavobacteriaceae bacterium]|nr:geranylgeranylglycerol-phosphate geranylgeranyltransferase [Flavobacteriaceae bacterium]